MPYNFFRQFQWFYFYHFYLVHISVPHFLFFLNDFITFKRKLITAMLLIPSTSHVISSTICFLSSFTPHCPPFFQKQPDKGFKVFCYALIRNTVNHCVEFLFIFRHCAALPFLHVWQNNKSVPTCQHFQFLQGF